MTVLDRIGAEHLTARIQEHLAAIRAADADLRALGYRSPRTLMADDLYFIQDTECSAIKIGRSRNPHARLRELQAGNPHRLSLLAVAEGRGEREFQWHRAFSADRLCGEWFAVTADLLEMIKDCACWI